MNECLQKRTKSNENFLEFQIWPLEFLFLRKRKEREGERRERERREKKREREREDKNGEDAF